VQIVINFSHSLEVCTFCDNMSLKDLTSFWLSLETSLSRCCVVYCFFIAFAQNFTMRHICVEECMLWPNVSLFVTGYPLFILHSLLIEFRYLQKYRYFPLELCSKLWTWPIFLLLHNGTSTVTNVVSLVRP